MKVDQSLARDAVQKLADKLGMGVLETANGILDIVAANMAKAIRVISVQRGYDPREYTLVAFGGAGPVHAARLARELGMTRILIPRTPGVLCALGLLMTDLRTDFSSTAMLRLDAAEPQKVGAIYDKLSVQASAWFDREKIAAAARKIERTVDVRFVGQNYELAVELPEGPLTADTFAVVRQRFLDTHRQLYGFAAEHEPIQLVTFRLAASGLVTKADFRAQPLASADASAAVSGSREVWMVEAGGFVPTTLYDRALLKHGNVVTGPAIVDQMDSTTVVPPGMTATVDAYLNLILEAK
jgi:N-methylhydantoinase A